MSYEACKWCSHLRYNSEGSWCEYSPNEWIDDVDNNKCDSYEEAQFLPVGRLGQPVEIRVVFFCLIC